jgi:hypothetical protein
MKAWLPLLIIVGMAGCTTHRAESPQSWEVVYLGMSRQQIHAIFGRPDESYSEESNADSVTQARDHWKPRSEADHRLGLDVSYNGEGRAVGVGHGCSLILMKVELEK